MTEPLEPFATLPELQDRLDWTLDTDESRIASSALEDASDQARHYGRSSWTPANAPRMVRTIVLAACVRYMRNPEGYIQSRAGDEMVGWSDTHKAGGSVSLSADEITLLRELAGSGPFIGSASISAWGTDHRRYRRRHHTQHMPGEDAGYGHGDSSYGCDDGEGYVPVVGEGKGFPLFDSDTSPW